MVYAVLTPENITTINGDDFRYIFLAAQYSPLDAYTFPNPDQTLFKLK